MIISVPHVDCVKFIEMFIPYSCRKKVHNKEQSGTGRVYKHSLTFRVRRYVVIANETRAPTANPPNSAQLQGSPTIPATYIQVRVVERECVEGQTDTQTHTDGRDHYTSCFGYALCEM